MIKFFTYNFKVTFIKLIFFACELYLFQEIPLNAIILFSGIDIFSLILNFLPTDLLLNSIMPVLLMQQDQLNMYLLIFYLLKSLLISLSYLKIIQKTTIKLAGSEEDIANHKTDNFHNYKYITLNNASIEDKFINEQTKDKFIFETMNNSYKNMISFLLNQTKTLNFSKIEINNNLSNLIITNDIHILTQINEYMSNWAVITNDEICIKYAQILNKTINSYNTNYNNIFDFYNFNLQIITEDMKEYGSLISKIFMYNKYINIMWDDFTLKKSKINILKQNGLNKKMSIEQNSDKKIIHINLKNILDLDIKSFFNDLKSFTKYRKELQKSYQLLDKKYIIPFILHVIHNIETESDMVYSPNLPCFETRNLIEALGIYNDVYVEITNYTTSVDELVNKSKIMILSDEEKNQYKKELFNN